MLYKETVSAEFFELIQELCKHAELSGFVLVGGTALSLQIGHRKSIDIDLFSSNPFDSEGMAEFFQSKYDFQVQTRFKNALMGMVNNVKVDIISHQYDWINDTFTQEGIRMAGLEDIAAMKLNAIIGNGSRLKDYADIAFLSSHFSLQQMLDFFEKKYPNNNSVIALKSLCYFQDINFDVDLQYQKQEVSWKQI
jgi:hypothetical protein